MISRWICIVLASLATLTSVAQVGADVVKPTSDKVGIFDLRAIRAHPLHVEVVSTTESEGIITEEIRYNALPGVRVLAYLCYPRGASKLPGSLTVQVSPVTPPLQEARFGAVGIAVCPTTGNLDDRIEETIGGPPFTDKFADDPEQSWIYHNVVALQRMLEYLESRPEIDLRRTLVHGHQWGGWLASLLHAVNNSVSAYLVWQGTGYYTGFDGMLNGAPAAISRRHFEMYAPAAYAQYGTRPIMVGYALNDPVFSVDAIMAYAGKLKAPHVFTLIAHSANYATPRVETFSGAVWATYWMNGGETPMTLSTPEIVAAEGRVLVDFSLDGQQSPLFVEVLYSYGAPGFWSGRTWHRQQAEKITDEKYRATIPLYDPIMPVLAVVLVESVEEGMISSAPLLIEPDKLGLGVENAEITPYPMMLQDFEDQDDLYILDGTTEFVTDSAEGFYAARVTPGANGTIRLLKFEAQFWKNARTLSIALKGDGRPGPVVLSFHPGEMVGGTARDRRVTQIVLVPGHKIFPNEWKTYKIPLQKITNLAQVRMVSLSVGNRDVLIDQIVLEP